MNTNQTTTLQKSEIDEFNRLYSKACTLSKGIAILEGYRPKRIGFFERIRANRSIKYFNLALAIYPQHFASLFFLGKIYQRLADYNRSLLYFEQALKFEKANPNLPQEASIVAMHLGLIDKAIEYSAEAVLRAPDHAAILGNHAMNLLIAGRDREATATIQQALASDPNDTINHGIKQKINDVLSGKVKRPTFTEIIG